MRLAESRFPRALRIERVRFRHNTARERGGGSYISTVEGKQSDPTGLSHGVHIVQSVFQGNSVSEGSGGGLFLSRTESVSLKFVNFFGNTAGSDGGGSFFSLVGEVLLSRCQPSLQPLPTDASEHDDARAFQA